MAEVPAGGTIGESQSIVRGEHHDRLRAASRFCRRVVFADQGGVRVPQTIQVERAHRDDSAALVYADDDVMNRNTLLVNGKPWPYFRVGSEDTG